jgi:hypothetical protein
MPLFHGPASIVKLASPVLTADAEDAKAHHTIHYLYKFESLFQYSYCPVTEPFVMNSLKMVTKNTYKGT